MQFEVDTNTYMNITEADSIIEAEFDSDSDEYKLWGQLDEQGKQRLILQGTRLIDNLPFLGIRAKRYQSMAWPRKVYHKDVECPYDVKLAILKQTLKKKVESTKQESKLRELGVKSYSIKDASISFVSDPKNNKLGNGVYEDIYQEYLNKWVY